MVHHRAQRFLVSLSLANLVFFKQWSDLLNAKPYEAFYENLTAYPASVWALYVGVLAVAAVLYASLSVSTRLGFSNWGYLLFLPALFVALNGARLALNEQKFSWGYLVLVFGKGPAVLLGLLVLGGLVYTSLRYHRLGMVALERTLCVFSLMLVINIMRTLPIAIKPVPRAKGAVSTADSTQRIFWFVFDGMDYRVTFPDRPEGVSLPHLDWLRAHANFWTRAHAPGPETNRSMPAYLAGRSVTRALVPNGEGGFELGFEGGAPSAWDPTRTLFAKAQQLGASAAIVGWHLPYCEVLAETATRCTRYPHYDAKKQPYEPRFWPSVQSLFKELAQLRWRDTQVHAANYQNILKDTLTLIADRGVKLVFVHWPIPHNPVIFGDGKVRTDAPNYYEGHFENLKLADVTIGKVVDALKSSGQWENSTLIVTSDHPSRAIEFKDGIRDPRVPLIVKMPHQQVPEEIASPVNTLQVHDWVLESLASSQRLSRVDLRVNEFVPASQSVARQESRTY